MNALDYLTNPVVDRVTYEHFLATPFYAFLRQAVHLTDAFNSCVRHFQKKRITKEYTKDSIHSMQEIASPLVVSIMSNLELFQRSVYARLFDLSSHIPDLGTEALLEKLKAYDVGIRHIIGYRGASAAAGNIIADALGSWHDPGKVNQHFEALLNIPGFYPDDVMAELAVLWQMRHSIVHTGGTLTVPDSQKIPALVAHGGKPVIFRHQFLEAIVRRLHKILKRVHDGFYPKVTGRFKAGYAGQVKKNIDTLFRLDSPRKSWLN